MDTGLPQNKSFYISHFGIKKKTFIKFYMNLIKIKIQMFLYHKRCVSKKKFT